MAEVPCRTSLVPLAFPCFLHCLIGVETEGLLDYEGRAGDHFHCTVEPPSGHIRCRQKSMEWSGGNLVAQCSATPATVAATPPCSATPFQTQISVRHLLAQGGEEVRHQNL